MKTVKFIKSMAVFDEILNNFLALRVIEGDDAHNVISPSKSDELLVKDLFALAEMEVAKVGFSVLELIQNQRSNLVFNTSHELAINWTRKGYSYVLTIAPRACLAPSLRIKQVEYTFDFDDKGFSKQTSFVTLYK